MVTHRVPDGVDIIEFNGRVMRKDFFSKFMPGDTVRLKSGGPDMTYTGIKGAYDLYGRCLCQWFEGKDFHEGWFSSESLILEN